ncbi:AMIN domain-containing protein [Pseudomonas sp. IC_126]|uniref:N-acetylmuramoyl-L-alanine amidase n=1 Tax=Pseudomonas sp. IC_126 TaxID=2547400 RepID=UPI00103A6E3A|nr:N-acetylmuramoyl-L-alanine amidase [Pseudomonas sp. IC_126]TCD22888.1 AMIN domain-containing protein [Pseudomonas sp. IC_126]
MRMRALVSGLVLMLAAVQALAASDVQSVRLWRAPDNTRLVFDLSGPVQHNVFTLTAPDRIVIDVNGGNLPKPFEQLALKNTPISGLRAAKFDADTLRVVIDLSAQVTPKSFTLTPNQQYGHRLVVDLYDEGADPSTTADIPATTTPSTPAEPVSPTLPALKLPPLPSSKRDIIIAIDAGHGGEDPGAIGPGKAYEKNVVLQISKELQRQINAEKGFRAELVRTGDYFIPLRKRTEIARKKGADLFVSIHADAAPRSSAYGASVFALSDRGATSETARWLADSENRSDLIGGAGSVNLGEDQMLAGVLLDLSMTASLASSLNVGQKVLSNMGRMTRLHKSRVEQAGFMVLKSPDIPSILVETGFISNPSEARKLQTASHQQSLARSIHSGVRQFFHENPPPGTYVAWLRDSGKIASVPREHVVRSGESLALLAQRYQISLPALRSANSLKGDVIKVGQTLNIPATTLASQP